MRFVIIAVAAAVWLYLLRIFRKTNMKAWFFIIGSLGLFTIFMVVLVPYLTMPLARSVAAIAGLFGSLTGWFEPFYKYGMIFIKTASGALSLRIDFECSGIIEILAFECLLAFFDVYQREEKVIVGILGFCAIMLLNAVRIVLICTIVHFFGTEAFFIAHTYIGRIFFYLFTVLLYFYVFTKAQVVRMKVGKVAYGHFKKDS